MAALRRIIASRRPPSTDPQAPQTQGQAQGSHALSSEHPAWSDAKMTAEEQQAGSPHQHVSATTHSQQADAKPLKAGLTGDAQDSGASGSSGDLLSCRQHPDSTPAHAEPTGDAHGSAPDASCQHDWQVQHCVNALAQQLLCGTAQSLLRDQREMWFAGHLGRLQSG